MDERQIDIGTENSPVDNMQKYANYKEQFKRLRKALTNGFYLEAVFIEYAILEDRTESVLKHAGIWDTYLKKRRGNDPTIDSKVKYIKSQALSNRKSILFKYFSDDLLDDILAWKDDRNRLIHALLKQQFAHNEIKELAEQGNNLVVKLRNRAGNCNRAMERK